MSRNNNRDPLAKKEKHAYESLTAAIGKLVSRHPGKVALFFVCLTVAMWFPLRKIDTSTKLSDYLPKCEFLKADDTLRREFGTPFPVISIVQAGSGNILDKKGLMVLANLERAIVSSEVIKPYLMNYGDPVVSIYDMVVSALPGQIHLPAPAASAAGGPGIPPTLPAGISPTQLDPPATPDTALASRALDLRTVPDDVLAKVISQVLQNESAATLVSSGPGHEGQYAILLVNFQHNKISRDDEIAEKALLAVLKNNVPPGYHYDSVAAKNYNMEKDAKDSLRLLLPISLGLIWLVLMVSLRRIMDLLISLTGLAVVMVISFGIFSLLHLQFSQMTFFAPIIIMVLGIDYAIYILHRYREYYNGGLDAADSISASIRFTGLPILFCALTTVAGFASNSWSKIPAVTSFGLFLALGMAVSFLVMTFLVPSLKLLYLRLFAVIFGRVPEQRIQPTDSGGQAKPHHGKIDYDRSVSTLEKFLYSHSVTVIVIALVLCAAGLLAAVEIKGIKKGINRDMTSKDICAKDSTVLKTQDLLTAEFPGIGMDRAHIIIEGDICDPKVLSAVNKAIANMQDDIHVAKVDSTPKVNSIIPLVRGLALSPALAPGIVDKDHDGLPDNREAMTAILTSLYEKGFKGGGQVISAGQVHALLSQGDSQRPISAMLLTVETYNTTGTAGGELLADLKEDLKPLEGIDAVKISYAGYVFDRYETISQMINGMIWSTLSSIIVCTLMVIILYKSVRVGLITALPIILITGWTLGTMYLFGVTLSITTATLTAMGIGVGIDYSIHLVERYRHERHLGRGLVESMAVSLESHTPSMLGAAGTTVCGFIVLGFAKISMIRAFGIMACVMIVFALISALLVLPAMLFVSERAAERRIARQTPKT